MERSAVALFVKAPEPGRVKTRLARTIGERAACDLYGAMVEDLLRAAACCGTPFFLFHDSARQASLPPSWGARAHGVVRQTGETLGERMCAAFELLFDAGYRKVVLVGSDIPGIGSAVLKSALAALEESDAAIAPAVDGGYCLIGLTSRGYRRRLFEGIEWSTDSVLEATTGRIAECGLRLHLLDRMQDIDTLEDLMAYGRNRARGAAATNRWLASWLRRMKRSRLSREVHPGLGSADPAAAPARAGSNV